MRIPRAAALMLATAFYAVATGGAGAFTASILRDDKVSAYISGAGANSPYAAMLVNELLAEIRRTALPFVITAPTPVLVQFAINRRGEVLRVAALPKSSPKAIHDYAEMIVRNASRRFTAPPADTPGDPLLFALPLRLQ